MHLLTRNQMPRTNNYAEGYHNNVRRIFNYAHPPVYGFFAKMLEHQAQIKLKLSQARERAVVAERTNNRNFAVRIQRIVSHIDEYENKIEFVSAIADCIEYSGTQQPNSDDGPQN